MQPCFPLSYPVSLFQRASFKFREKEWNVKSMTKYLSGIYYFLPEYHTYFWPETHRYVTYMGLHTNYKTVEKKIGQCLWNAC